MARRRAERLEDRIPKARAAAAALVRFSRTRRGKTAIAVVSAALAAGALLVAVRHFIAEGWPLRGGDPTIIATVGVLFVIAYGLKAFGWARLFRPAERPPPLALAAAGGCASIMGLALPGRFDEAVRVLIVRRYPACPVGVKTICFSLVTLGLIDTIALFPLATVSATFPDLSPVVRAGFAIVGAGGLGAAAVVVLLPRLASSARLVRLRLVRWLVPRAAPLREASQAWALVFASWLVRVAGLVLLLHTLGLGFSIPLAIMFVCAGAASAAIPFGPAGAATQVGAGTTLLVVADVDVSQALGFALAAQGLMILSGAAIFAFAVAWRSAVGLRTLGHNKRNSRVLERDRGDHERMEDLVVPEGLGKRIRPRSHVDDGAERVADPARQGQKRRGRAGFVPELGDRDDTNPA
jgi:uncharacterized membrane protein YbhN (UPF0104 family)